MSKKLYQKRLKQITNLLVKDSRITLRDLSEKLNIPVSTIWDIIQREIKMNYDFTIVRKGTGTLEKQDINQYIIAMVEKYFTTHTVLTKDNYRMLEEMVYYCRNKENFYK